MREGCGAGGHDLELRDVSAVTKRRTYEREDGLGLVAVLHGAAVDTSHPLGVLALAARSAVQRAKSDEPALHAMDLQR